MEKEGHAQAPRLRREDDELVTGDGEYADDISREAMVHAAIHRSRYGHARIEGIDTDEAERHDGVLAVYTAADLADSGTPGKFALSGPYADQPTINMPLLGREKVRYAGEPLAVALAESRYTASQAAEAIDVSYDTLDSVIEKDAALAEDSPTVHESAPHNCGFDWEFGDADAVEAAIASAPHSVSLQLDHQKLIPDPMEPRAAVAEYDTETGRVTLRPTTQAPHGVRNNISTALGIPEHKVRVVAPKVGGGFGTKGASPYPEDPLVVWSAMQLNRPVKWTATRSEDHQTLHHGRDFDIRGTMAFDEDGTILGLDIDGEIGIGAYQVWPKTGAQNFRTLASGAYEIPAIYGSVTGVYTNTAPTGPYRGAGRPETIYTIERLMNQAAHELGMDPVELRRRNLIPVDAFPYQTAHGPVYDSGDYERALDKALELLDYEAVRERQAELREEGRYLGVGISTFVENTGTGPGVPETSRIVFHKNGRVTAYSGTFDHGQGHETTFAQLLSDQLGVPYEDIEIREGDTDDLRTGIGTFGSRSVPVGGSSLATAAEKIIDKAKDIAAFHLEAPKEEIEFEDGDFYVVGDVATSVHIQEIVGVIFSDRELPGDLDTGLEAEAFYEPENNAFAFGTHVAVVEVNPDTGEIEIERYVGVDDCGVQINPDLVKGQIHGGVAQGIGEALYEEAIYDASGGLLSGTLQDYALPNAHHVPDMEFDHTVTPCPHNPIGAKGTGEAGTIAAPPAIINGIVDAARPFDVDNVDMPATPERVWRACQSDD